MELTKKLEKKRWNRIILQILQTESQKEDHSITGK
nr:MAG TPA: outer membrane lipoprotein [Caudoviricetes sp.]